jgi:hypothetical protein
MDRPEDKTFLRSQLTKPGNFVDIKDELYLLPPRLLAGNGGMLRLPCAEADQPNPTRPDRLPWYRPPDVGAKSP